MSTDKGNLVGQWSVPLNDGVYVIEFEHGTSSGKRVLKVNGQEIIRKDWMFKLVGDETFTIGKDEVKCELKVNPIPPFTFAYVLYVNGKPFRKFIDQQHRSSRYWTVLLDKKRHTIVLDKCTQEVQVNGEQVETESVFTSDGITINFIVGQLKASITATTANKKHGVIQDLYINDKLVPSDDF